MKCLGSLILFVCTFWTLFIVYPPHHTLIHTLIILAVLGTMLICFLLLVLSISKLAMALSASELPLGIIRLVWGFLGFSSGAYVLGMRRGFAVYLFEVLQR